MLAGDDKLLKLQEIVPFGSYINQCSCSPFVTFMSNISMSVDREWMTLRNYTVQKVANCVATAQIDLIADEIPDTTPPF